jgi:titin
MAAVPTSTTTIRLEWTSVDKASRYAIDRSIDNVDWKEVASTNGGHTAYTDVALSSGTTYYYRIVASVQGQDASPSDTVSATTTVDTSTPPVFTSATGSVSSIELEWSDLDGELGYQIERSTDPTTGWIVIGTTGQDVTSYTDTGLVSATWYYYRVVAVTPDGESPPSKVISATTDAEAPATSQANAHPSSAAPS